MNESVFSTRIIQRDELVPETEEDPSSSKLIPDELALCLSGGGYRAAAFHLGVLDLLHRTGLLNRVGVLSAVSGGSLTAAIYCLNQAWGNDFEGFYHHLYSTLLERNVVADSFSLLHETSSQEAPPSLVRAAARVFRTADFVGIEKLSTLIDSDRVPADVLFGATEFRGGRAFRFQVSKNHRVVLGSVAPLQIPENLGRELYLADIIAASSCFPGAFEPILFPDDFGWDRSLQGVRDELGEGFERGLPLMDGGIYDNQGVDGALAVYRRTGRDPGLVLVSDTSPRPDEMLPTEPRMRRSGWSLARIASTGRVLFWGAVLSTAFLLVKAGWDIRDRGPRWNDALLTGFPILLLLAFIGALLWLRSRWVSEQRRLQQLAGISLWPAIRHLSISDLIELAEQRARSLVTLTRSVFMKRVRGLIQSSLKSNQDLRDKVLFNLIYDLDRERKPLYEQYPWLRPSPEQTRVARTAEKIRTKMWFEHRDDLRDLIACGQLTTCFTLLEHICRGSDGLLPPETLNDPLFKRLREIWSLLRHECNQLVLDPDSHRSEPGPKTQRGKPQQPVETETVDLDPTRDEPLDSH